MNGIFEVVTNFMQITGNSTVDSVLLWIIGIISASISFGIIGMIFDFIKVYDSDLMSNLHWSVRLLIFGALSALMIEFFKFINWLFSFPLWVYFLILIVIVCIVILIFYLKHKHAKKISVEKTISLQGEQHDEVKQIINNKSDICPRCGGVLVKRQGPYGKFYGCSNFSKTGCKYTRKFK